MMTLKDQYETLKKQRKLAFHGASYMYPTPSHGLQPIGVTQGLGGDCWIVAYITQSGARRKIKTLRLPVLADPVKLQQLFDIWATERKLTEATHADA